MKGFILMTCFIITMFCEGLAQRISPDASFGANGIVLADLGTPVKYNSSPQKVLAQADGSIYVLIQLSQQTLISKRLADGSADLSYGTKGFSAPIPFPALQSVLQTDNKIVVVGLFKNGNTTLFGLARFNTDGTLDTTFNKKGIQTTGFGSDDNQAISVTIDDNNKIVVAGFASVADHFDFAIARYNTNGSLDKTFSDDGKLTTNFGSTDDFCQTIFTQKSGKITAVGYNYDYINSSFNIAIARYNNDGSPDNTFGNNGKQNTEPGFATPKGAVMQADGKILVMSKLSDYVLLRYNTNGTLDDTFGSNGMLSLNFSLYEIIDIALQNDKKIVIAGHGPFNNSDFLLARFTADGKIDNTFSEDGQLTTDFGSVSEYLSSIAIQHDGKIIANGFTQTNGNTNSVALARYNSDGTADEGFGDNGKLIDNFQQGITSYTAVAVQKDKKVIAAGSTWNGFNYDFVVSRYNTNGTLDKTFNNDGYQVVDFEAKDDFINSIAIQPDGKIIAVGYSGPENNSEFALARFNTDGTLDKAFDLDGQVTTRFTEDGDVAHAVAVQTDNKIVVTGSAKTEFDFNANRFYADFVIARYNTDGSLDDNFSGIGFSVQNLGGDDIPKSLALQADGKIIAGGYSQIFDGSNVLRSAIALLRLNTDGQPDNGFSEDGVELDAFSGIAFANAVAVQPDGKILATGTILNEVINDKIIATVRYRPNGGLDETFNGSGLKTGNSSQADLTANSMAVQQDGKILIGGSFNNDFAIWRLNADGTTDNDFGKDGLYINAVSASDDKIHTIALAGNKLYAAGFAQIPGSLGIAAGFVIDDIKEIPPTVKIITPADNTSFIAPANIRIDAAASDADGVIMKVEFYINKVLLRTETVIPYGFKWPDVPVGEYTIIAIATDNNGLVTTSAPVYISVARNKPPTVSFTKPGDFHIFPAPANIRMEVNAKDADGRITKVEFYNGSVLLHKEYKAPYTFRWPGVPVGKYIITAKAFDNWGASSTSSINISVEKNKAPVVNITSPANNSNHTAPANITLAATATDPDGRITNVDFFNGSTLIHKEYKLPYQWQWQNVAAGNYTITAVARDNFGVKTTSAPVTFTVTSDEPVVTKNLTSQSITAETQTASGIKLSPNPAKNILTISIDGLQLKKQVNISVISASGVIVKTMRSSALTQIIQQDVSSLQSGIYTVKIISGDKVMYRQFVKL